MWPKLRLSQKSTAPHDLEHKKTEAVHALSVFLTASDSDPSPPQIFWTAFDLIDLHFERKHAKVEIPQTWCHLIWPKRVEYATPSFCIPWPDVLTSGTDVYRMYVDAPHDGSKKESKKERKAGLSKVKLLPSFPPHFHKDQRPVLV